MATNKPKIHAHCRAGCEWETVHYSDFEKSASIIKIPLDENGVASVDLLKKYRIEADASKSQYEVANFADNFATDFIGMGCAIVTYGKKIYFLGGANALHSNPLDESAGFSNAVFSYDTETNTFANEEWTTAATGLKQGVLADYLLCTTATAAAVGEHAYIYGGARFNASNGEYERSTKPIYYNLRVGASDNASAGGSFDVSDSVAVAVGDKIYLFGGEEYFENAQVYSWSAGIWVHDTANHTISRLATTLPTAAMRIGACAVGTKIYLFGGETAKDFGGKLDTIYVFDTETETIEQYPVNLPFAASRISAAAIGNRIYLSGFEIEGDTAAERGSAYGDMLCLDLENGIVVAHDFKTPIKGAIVSIDTHICFCSGNGGKSNNVALNGAGAVCEYTPFAGGCYIKLDITGADNIGFDVNVFDEYRKYYTFECLALKVNEAKDTVTIVFETDGERRMIDVRGTDIDTTDAKLLVYNADALYRYNPFAEQTAVSDMPEVTSADEGSILRVQNGKWAAVPTFGILEKEKIYGVDGVGGSNITRTDHAVGLSFEVGESEINSDFSNCFPWSDICDVIRYGEIRGEQEVKQHKSIFVKIPKFYSKITKNADGTYKHQISGTRYDGFSTLFIDGNGDEIDYVLVGKYEAAVVRPYIDGGYNIPVAVSDSIYPVGSGRSIEEARQLCKINGAGFQQYDVWINAIIQELFLVEFATTDCQSIMAGYTNGNAAFVATGATDTVKTPSGSPVSNKDGNRPCKYRGIENLWGNYWHYIDGIRFVGDDIYVSSDPTNYSSGKNVGHQYDYVCVGTKDSTVGTSKFVDVMKQFEHYPLLGFPVGFADTVDEANYHGAYYTNKNGSGQILVGSWHKSSGKRASLWSYNTCDTEDFTSSAYGFRLCYKPIK